MYTLAWSSATAAYELYQTRDRKVLRIAPDSPEWFAWLNQVPSFTFSGKSGHYTARKETKQRGGHYWYAYLATGEQLTKKYLGKTIDLTLERLEQMAGILCTASAAQTPLPVFLAAGTDGGVGTAQHPIVPQRRTPSQPLLAAKLHLPRPRAQLVPRDHLVERLQQGVAGALTLVSAPAGFGKTTLLAQWLAHSGMPVAWLSLEPEDNDPTRFLSYLIAALQSLDARLGITALAMLHMPQPPAPEVVLAVLTNELASWEAENFVFVLDDYHTITADPIQRGMVYLVEHLPPQLHLILSTRADPPFPLARLRAQGQLTEVRAADLRFGPAEASAFLQTVMGLNLGAEAVATLEQRTEGWIAGLQLAALFLQGRTDVAEFLAAFTGSHRYVLDYLSEAVQHALAAPDFERAVRLIEPLALSATFQGQISTVLGWLNARPRLWFTTRAGIAALSGDVECAIPLARQALELLPEAEVIPRAGAMVVTALVYVVSGEVTSVIEHEAAAAVALNRGVNNLFTAVNSICQLARLHVLQGRLRQASATFAEVMQVVPRLEVLHTMYSSFQYYFGLGDLLRERNEAASLSSSTADPGGRRASAARTGAGPPGDCHPLGGQQWPVSRR